MNYDISRETQIERKIGKISGLDCKVQTVNEFYDYPPIVSCKNPDTYGAICVKCGECGRKFDEQGVLQEQEVKNGHKTR